MNDRPRILIIDHDLQRRARICAWLQAEGFDPLVLGTNLQATAAVAAPLAQLILLATDLPGRHSVAAYQDLRGSPVTRHTPMLIIHPIVPPDYWEPLPFETDGPTYVTGNPTDETILLGRIHQMLNVMSER